MDTGRQEAPKPLHHVDRRDRRGRTGVCNLFLAGDASGDVHFAIAAAADGARAATAINREFQDEDQQQARARRRPALQQLLHRIPRAS